MIHLSDYESPGIPRTVVSRALAFVDCETTGFAPSCCDLIEVAVVSDDLPFQIKLAITPYDEERADNYQAQLNKYRGPERQLKDWRLVNGYNRKEWADAVPAEKAIPLICDQIAGKILVGHNLEFDLSFLRSAMERCGIPPRTVLSPTTIDTIPLAKACLPGMESYSLENVCKRLGIEPEGVHRAMGGAVRAKLVYEALTGAARRNLDACVQKAA